MVREQDNDRQPSAREILLMADILVTSQQDIESRLLRRVEQLTIL